jgi:putative membrane protein
MSGAATVAGSSARARCSPVSVRRPRNGQRTSFLKTHAQGRDQASTPGLIGINPDFVLHILGSWLLLSLSMWLTALILPGFRLNGFAGAVRVAALFGILNWLLGWLIFVIIGIGTIGLGFLLAFITRWIVSAILLKLTDAFSKSLQIDGFLRAILAAMIMSAIGTFAEFLFTRTF